MARQLSDLLGDESMNETEVANVTSYTTAARIQQNNAALQDLVRQVTVANIVGATSLVGSDQDRIGDNDPVQQIAYDELVSLRDIALEAIDQELLKTTDDVVYKAIEDGYSAVFTDLTERAEKQAQLLDYTTPAVLPALVIAYDRYEDANRDLEIVERNKIRHEGFVPKAPIKLLSE